MKVRVSFTDKAGNDRSLASAATAVVVAEPSQTQGVPSTQRPEHRYGFP